MNTEAAREPMASTIICGTEAYGVGLLPRITCLSMYVDAISRSKEQCVYGEPAGSRPALLSSFLP